MKKPRITNLIFVPTGSYHDMALRPYRFHGQGEDIERLESVTDGFRNLTTSSLRSVAGSLLRPSTADVGTLSIDNGWNSQRYMYMMEIVYMTESNFEEENVALEVKYISGMTDRVGDPTYSGRLDPEMRMYIDKIIDTNEIETSRGVIRRPLSASRYLQQNVGQPRRSTESFFALRPRDVCTQLGNSGLGNAGLDLDFRSSISARPITSNISNDLPANYLSQTFSAYRTTVNDVNSSLDTMDLPAIMNTVADHTSDGGVIGDSFINQLQRYTGLAEGASYTYGELCSLFDGTEQATKLVAGADSTIQEIGFDMHQPNDTEHWFGTKQETLVATMAGQAIQALMVGSLLTQVAFTITNDTITGETQFVWLSAPLSFILKNMSLEQHALLFQDRFTHEVFRGLSRNDQLCLTLSVFCDIVQSDTRLEVTLEHGAPTPYCMPNFAGSMISPVIGNNISQLDHLAGAFNDVFDFMGSAALKRPSNDIVRPQLFSSSYSIPSVSRSTAPSPSPSSSSRWKL